MSVSREKFYGKTQVITTGVSAKFRPTQGRVAIVTPTADINFFLPAPSLGSGSFPTQQVSTLPAENQWLPLREGGPVAFIVNKSATFSITVRVRDGSVVVGTVAPLQVCAVLLEDIHDSTGEQGVWRTKCGGYETPGPTATVLTTTIAPTTPPPPTTTIPPTTTLFETTSQAPTTSAPPETTTLPVGTFTFNTTSPDLPFTTLMP